MGPYCRVFVGSGLALTLVATQALRTHFRGTTKLLHSRTSEFGGKNE
jgi:hypothetical protein